MTTDETTNEEKRSRRYWGFVLVGAVVIVAAAFIFWPRSGGRQGLSLRVVGYGTNSTPGDVDFVVALITVTNNTRETLVLGNNGQSWPVYFYVLGPAGSGWKRQPGGLILSGGRSVPSKLLPGQGLMVAAAIPPDRPCKVGLVYLNDRLSDRLWEKLPLWLTKKLSWESPWRTASTEVIDLSKPQ